MQVWSDTGMKTSKNGKHCLTEQQQQQQQQQPQVIHLKWTNLCQGRVQCLSWAKKEKRQVNEKSYNLREGI